jgi:hypothetical protein
MRIFGNLFRKELAKCWLCDKKIYHGDYYGFEHEPNSLSIKGYTDYYFCAACIERHCTSELIDDKSLGKTFIISRQSGERSRITIKR